MSNHASLLDGLKAVYKSKILPLEQASLFNFFNSAPLSDNDIDARPMVLLLGQYSTGKTTFINYLLGQNYAGSHIGPEPTTDKFVAIMHGESDRIIPGNAAAVQGDLPFSGLSNFGASFLSKFNVSCSTAPLSEFVTLIDTPGVLSGDKQRLGRTYDYGKVVEWFAARADMILLLFDAHKLDISDEFSAVLTALQGHGDKIRIALNKSDSITTPQLMRVYGALMWSLGKVIDTPEVMRVYVCSFWNPPEGFVQENAELIRCEQDDLLADLHNLPKQSTIRKVNELVKRARMLKVHACVLETLRKEMPTFFGAKSRQSKLISNLATEFTKVQALYDLPPGDFPDIERFQEKLKLIDLSTLSKVSSRMIAAVSETLSSDLPSLLEAFPQTNATFNSLIARNPFSDDVMTKLDPADPAIWTVKAAERQKYQKLFSGLCQSKYLSGAHAKAFFKESTLADAQLSHIWKLADADRDGYLDEQEFSIAMHLIFLCLNGITMPESVTVPSK